MKHFKLIFPALFMLMASFKGHSMEQFEVICSTPREKIVLRLEENSVSFLKDHGLQKRTIASKRFLGNGWEGKSYSRRFSEEGLTYRVHVENMSQFSDLDDYILISNQRGHQMIYPLNCKKQ